MLNKMGIVVVFISSSSCILLVCLAMVCFLLLLLILSASLVEGAQKFLQQVYLGLAFQQPIPSLVVVV